MTLVTIRAVVNVPTDIGVLEIGCVVVAMATSALEHRVVIRVRMAGCANSIRVAVIGREIRVIEGRPRPGGGGVAGVTSGWESGRLMVRIGGVVVIGLVTAHARRWQSRVVVIDVAHHAGHGRCRVEPRQRERGVVVIKGRARPVRGAMAGIARGRESCRCVWWRIRTVVVGLVARDAGRIGRRQTIIPVHMALRAL